MSAHASCQFQKQLLVEIVKLLELCLAALVINRELSANINTTDSHTLQEEFEKSFVQMVRLLYNTLVDPSPLDALQLALKKAKLHTRNGSEYCF